MIEFDKAIKKLHQGSYDVIFNEKRYLLSVQVELDAKLIKLYAKELGGNDFVSLNYYPYIRDGLLKPCEMPVKKVKEFVLNLEVIGEDDGV